MLLLFAALCWGIIYWVGIYCKDYFLEFREHQRLIDAALHAPDSALDEADPLRALDEVALVGQEVGPEGLHIGVLVRLVHGVNNTSGCPYSQAFSLL